MLGLHARVAHNLPRVSRIVAGRDAPPILEPCKHILDFVALLIERLVIGQRDFPAFGGGYAGLAASFGESIPETITSWWFIDKLVMTLMTWFGLSRLHLRSALAHWMTKLI